MMIDILEGEISMVSCKEYAKLKKEELKKYIERNGLKPCLVVIQIGDEPESNSYIRGKVKDCEEVGIECRVMKFELITQKVLEAVIKILNKKPDVHGIILQLPVPEDINVNKIQTLIDPKNDVDGFNPMSPFEPCTPLGIINYLKYVGYEFKGRDALVIGRSDIVGKPLARMLTDLDCTVTLAHSKTRSIYRYSPYSDIVFTCINEIEWFDKYTLPIGFTDSIIDIGLGLGVDGRLHGNLECEYAKTLKQVNPNRICISGIGGVGLLTRVTLLENVVKACSDYVNYNEPM